MRNLLFFLVVLFPTVASAQSSPKYENTMLVLDVSGSMWGQIAGEAKIDIARSSLKKVVADWPGEREVGLLAYGHRRKGDCEDIEVLLPLEPFRADVLSAKIDELKPKGMTPLSEAVTRAAEALKFTEQKATVILLSDGIETCEKDPCAVGRQLEELGIDFTAHVIGFDVKDAREQQQLRCLAENTGGVFISADNAEQLIDALSKTTKVDPPKALPEASLSGPARVVKASIGTYQAQSEEKAIPGYLYLYSEGSDKRISFKKVATDKYNNYAPVEIRFPAEIGRYRVQWETTKREVLASTQVEVIDSTVVISTEPEAAKGTKISVSVLEAPAGLDGYIYLFPGGGDKHLSYRPVRESATEGYEVVHLQAPAKPGNYDLVWKTRKGEELARTELKVVEADIVLNAPAQVQGGTKIEVSLDAPPGLYGYVYLFPRGGKKSISYARVYENNAGGYKLVSLAVPARAGEYELRYLSNKKELLAARDLLVEATSVRLEVPDAIPRATEFQVSPKAPAGLGGYLYLYKAGQKKDISHKRVYADAYGEYKEVTLLAPAVPGAYILSWKTRKGEELGTARITIEDADFTLNAPSDVYLEDSFQVNLQGPDSFRGYVYLYAEGASRAIIHKSVRSSANGGYEALSFSSPEQTGIYELRLISSSKELISTQPFRVR